MEFTVGALLEGKVKSITKFGAFITLPENRTGMVHISEVANTYVSDIHDHPVSYTHLTLPTIA